MSIEVRAPMPGKIVGILVKEGDQVNADDELLILEAMKMENPIYSPMAGRVIDIKVKEKDKVESDQVLMILE
ncbi:MAG: acetyl-CoA carboxylase biotin carboxyl carrier protein subunit [Syntrophales bacterium]|nr:acetyl-CoA carboxylase biotin carboxyl carrier protein subunit [Syntrophales bacterium]